MEEDDEIRNVSALPTGSIKVRRAGTLYIQGYNPKVKVACTQPRQRLS